MNLQSTGLSLSLSFLYLRVIRQMSNLVVNRQWLGTASDNIGKDQRKLHTTWHTPDPLWQQQSTPSSFRVRLSKTWSPWVLFLYYIWLYWHIYAFFTSNELPINAAVTHIQTSTFLKFTCLCSQHLFKRPIQHHYWKRRWHIYIACYIFSCLHRKIRENAHMD